MKNMLQYSIDNNLRHIPSALSQYSYLKYLLPKLDYDNTNIVIGKPFGSQAYYCIWEEMGLIKNQKLSYGVKHDEIDFVNFSEETLGNALGVGSGIAYNGKKTYVNISDGALQMGPTLEAIQFIGKHKQNIFCTVDFNSMQLTGDTQQIIGINIFNVESMFRIYGWTTIMVDTKRTSKIIIESFIERALKYDKPIAIIFKTIKGQGVKEMEEDPVAWHYKELKSLEDIEFDNSKG
jgi:transketolase N-terminal domain/subunit